MGVVIGRGGAWRRYVGLAAAMIAAVVTLLAAGRTAKQREEEPRVRLVDADATANAKSVQLARVNSLWLEGRGMECLVPAVYGAVESARFASVLLWRGAPAAQKPAPTIAALQARLAEAYDGVALEGAVTVEGGEPATVSIQRSAKFTPTALAA